MSATVEAAVHGTGLLMQLGFGAVSTSAWIVAMMGMWAMWLMMGAWSTAVWAVRLPRMRLTVTAFVFMCVFTLFLRRGFNLEGNMEEPLTEEAEQWLVAVEEEQRAIDKLPFVKSVGFSYHDTANLSKVVATVWCCWESSRSSFKQVKVGLHLEHRPTYLEALRELHAKLIREHGGALHEHDLRAVTQRAEYEGHCLSIPSAQTGGKPKQKMLVLTLNP